MLVVLAGAMVTMLVTRSNVDATILRTPGQLYQETKNGSVTNLYNISLINKTTESVPLTLKVLEPAGGTISMVGNELTLPEQGKTEGVFFVEIPKENLEGVSSKIRIGVFAGEELVTEEKTKFLAPAR